MKIRGSPAYHPGRAGTGMVSMLLLTWGLVWVVYITSYGVCTGDLDEMKRILKDKEFDTMRRTMEESENLYVISTQAQELAEELRGCRSEVDTDKIAVVIPCAADYLKFLTSVKSASKFHVYGVTDTSTRGICQEIIKTNTMDYPGIKINPFTTHSSHGGEAALLSDAVSDLISSHDYAHFIVIENHIHISEDGLQLLTAAAEQGMFQRRSDLMFFSLGHDNSDPSDPLRHHVSPDVFPVVVRDNLVPGGAFITSSGHWSVVSQAILESSPLLCATPLLPRASGHAIHHEAHGSNVIPVFFPAVSLEYLASKHQYAEWLTAKNSLPVCLF